MIEMQLVNLSGLDSKSLVLCDTACNMVVEMTVKPREPFRTVYHQLIR